MTPSIDASRGCMSASPPLCNAISPTAHSPPANSSSSALASRASSMFTDGLSKSRLHHLHRRLHLDANSMLNHSSEMFDMASRIVSAVARLGFSTESRTAQSWEKASTAPIEERKRSRRHVLG